MAGVSRLKTADVLLRLILGGIFIAASADKIVHPVEFAAIVRDYRVLPPALSNLTALLLPWLELVLGALLLAGRWREGTLFLVNLLLVTFWTTLVVNYFRGIDVACGCFSTTPDQDANMLWYIVRDGFFVLLGLAAVLVTRKLAAISGKT